MIELLEKILIAAAAPVIAIILAALFGHRLASVWSDRQKRRELELALAGSFYASYGEFRSVWKEWTWCLASIRRNDPEDFAKRKLLLHERICRAEGSLEAVLLKIASERKLELSEARDLSSLRFFYRVARYSIQDERAVPFRSPDDVNYLEFKRLSTFIGSLLVYKKSYPPSPNEAFEAFKEITKDRPIARRDKSERTPRAQVAAPEGAKVDR